MSAVIDKIETDEDLKLDFEAMVASILPWDHIANNKAYSNKNEKHSVSDTRIASMVGGRDQQTKLDLRCYNIKEHKTLSNKDKSVLRE